MYEDPAAKPFAIRIKELINNYHKPRAELARAIGYDNPNAIQMFEDSTTRVPLDRVERLAIALDADPGELIQLWFDSYSPWMLPLLERYLYPQAGIRPA